LNWPEASLNGPPPDRHAINGLIFLILFSHWP
jgi:hypothetical protein